MMPNFFFDITSDKIIASNKKQSSIYFKFSIEAKISIFLKLRIAAKNKKT